jgi:hypothetical protein
LNCWRAAAPADLRRYPLCPSHLVDEQRAARVRRLRREEADVRLAEATASESQRRYAEAWRARYPEAAYTGAWACPLCGKLVQSSLAEVGPGHADWPLLAAVKAHAAAHGDDWLAYRAAGLAGDP